MIRVRGVHKYFKRYESPADRLKEVFGRRKRHTLFPALENVSFDVGRGEAVGIIGQNGAGKSTLLKVLTRVVLPDSGSVEIDGKITGLLELGTGFNYELDGIQNAYMNGTLLGMDRTEVESKLDDIIGFCELGDYIHEPLKSYSSGMVMRLAFAVAIFADPAAFVIDEALAVGDAYFQQKCISKIKSFKGSGGSIVLVSHDMNAVKILCDRALLMEKGIVLEEGKPEKVINKYHFYIAKLHDEGAGIIELRSDDCSYGTLEAKIRRIDIEGKESKSSKMFSGEEAVIRVEFDSIVDIDGINLGILIRDKYGQSIFGTNLHYLCDRTLNLKKNRTYRGAFEMKMDLGLGVYTITGALHTDTHHLDHCLHWVDNMGSFEISGYGERIFEGICRLYPKFSIVDSDGFPACAN